MKKILVRFEEESKNYLLVIDEVDKYLGKLNRELLELIWTTDNEVEEDGYIYYWCHKDLLDKYLEK